MAKKKGYFLYTIFLFIIFLITLISAVVFLDIIGVINLGKTIPPESRIGRVPYVGRYLKYSRTLHMSEQDRLETKVSQYQEILENQKRKLSIKEKELEKLKNEIQNKEKKLNEREEKLNQKEKELEEKEKEMEQFKLDYKAKTGNIDKFAEVYSEMEPQKAANVLQNINNDIAAKILEKMETGNVASILEFLSDADMEKTKKLTEMMTSKEGDTNGE